MSKEKLKKYLGDGLLIVFSVLFALFINRMAESKDVEQQKKTALNSIRTELHRNAAIVALWKKQHTTIQVQLDSLIQGKNDSLWQYLRQKDHLDLSALTEQQSLIEAVLSDTAWESAKSTGILAQFDFETTQKLTNVYKMQSVLSNETIRSILNFYFSKDAHKMNELDASLFQLHLRFNELVGQEHLMEHLYGEAINAIE